MKPSLQVKISANLGAYVEMMKKWPSLTSGILHDVGYIGRKTLQYDYLKGQIINLHVYPYGKDGRLRTVGYAIAKNQKGLKISSYPLNLYKPQEVYSQATGVVQARIEQALAAYDGRVFQRKLEELEGKR
jgi:hypothetical protein